MSCFYFFISRDIERFFLRILIHASSLQWILAGMRDLRSENSISCVVLCCVVEPPGLQLLTLNCNTHAQSVVNDTNGDDFKNAEQCCSSFNE